MIRRRRLLQTMVGGVIALGSEPLWSQSIDQIIQQNRTAPLQVQLLNSAGQPLPDQIVRIEHIRHHFQFGCAYHQHLAERPEETVLDRRLREYFLRLFNAATVTFYWGGYEPQRRDYQDQPLLERIQWLQGRNFYLRGHPLFWNHNPGCLPSWLIPGGYTSPIQLFTLMDELLEHLSKVIFPYLQEVDVFNELTWWYRQNHPLTPLFTGEQKIARAVRYFRAFQNLNPSILATINDYVPRPDYPQLIRQLLDNGAPIQAIGQQTHMHLEYWSPTMIQAILDRLSTFQKPIIFTEVSVLSAEPRPNLDFSREYTDWPSTPSGEQRQAQYLENFYKTLFAHPQVTGIYQWSLSDRHAWLNAPTGLLNTENQPKPAYLVLDRLINQTWRTRGEFRSDSQGLIKIPAAFTGTYRLTHQGQEMLLGNHTKETPLSVAITLS